MAYLKQWKGEGMMIQIRGTLQKKFCGGTMIYLYAMVQNDNLVHLS